MKWKIPNFRKYLDDFINAESCFKNSGQLISHTKNSQKKNYQKSVGQIKNFSLPSINHNSPIQNEFQTEN